MAKKKSIQDAKNLASMKDGYCLSEEYINCSSVLLWECNEKHQWFACYDSIRRGSWCPYCVKVAKLNIEIAKELAISRGGKCLSEIYINSHSKLLWECFFGHQWKATYSLVSRNRWCPYCKTSRSENICRIYLETIFNYSFPKFYPNWLKNNTNKQLELDGYCSELGIGFEHNGIHHYEKNKVFKTNLEQLQKNKANDQIKQKLCKENGVKLIIIPELTTKLKETNLLSFLKEKIISLGIDVINFPSEIKISENLLYSYSAKYTRKYNLEYFQNIAKEKGGELLSSVFVSVNHKMKWKCSCGFIWEAKVAHIKNDKTWCPQCNLNKGTIEKMQLKAAEFGGECLSDTYINNNTKLIWKCKNNHIFERRPRDLISGAWCPDPTCKRSKKIK